MENENAIKHYTFIKNKLIENIKNKQSVGVGIDETSKFIEPLLLVWELDRLYIDVVDTINKIDSNINSIMTDRNKVNTLIGMRKKWIDMRVDLDNERKNLFSKYKHY
jgi:hypothetical protein